MTAAFSIDVVPRSDLVKITMSGFFVDTDIAAFRMALTEKMQELRCDPNEHVTLCDVTGMKIQLQDIVVAFSQVVGDPVFRSRKLAFVTASTLARMQAKRLTDRPGVAFFTDETVAADWLLR